MAVVCSTSNTKVFQVGLYKRIFHGECILMEEETGDVRIGLQHCGRRRAPAAAEARQEVWGGQLDAMLSGILIPAVVTFVDEVFIADHRSIIGEDLRAARHGRGSRQQ